MHRAFQSFVDGLAASGDATSLRAVLADARAALDLSCFAYLSMPSRTTDAPALISTYPVEWTDHYLRHLYARIDPVIVEALTTLEPFEWGQEFPTKHLSKLQCSLLDETAQFGIRCGFTVPVRGPRGPIAAVTFAAEERRAPFQRCVEQHRHVLHCALGQSSVPIGCTLNRHAASGYFLALSDFMQLRLLRAIPGENVSIGGTLVRHRCIRTFSMRADLAVCAHVGRPARCAARSSARSRD